MMTPSAGLHFLTLVASLFGVGVALASAWRVRLGKRDVLSTPVAMPEGVPFLLWLCACIAVLTHKHANLVIHANFPGGAYTAAMAAYVLALVFVGLHVVLGAHIFCGSAFLYGSRHRNRGR